MASTGRKWASVLDADMEARPSGGGGPRRPWEARAAAAGAAPPVAARGPGRLLQPGDPRAPGRRAAGDQVREPPRHRDGGRAAVRVADPGPAPGDVGPQPHTDRAR